MLHCYADQARDNRHDTPFGSCACRRAHFAHPGRCPNLGCQDAGIGSIYPTLEFLFGNRSGGGRSDLVSSQRGVRDL
jgi:hypothetical protein